MSVTKKIFIISSVLLAAVLFFLGIYNISFKEKNETAKVAKNETSKDGEKSIAEKAQEKIGIEKKDKIFQLVGEAVTSPIIDKEGENIIYYLKSNGTVQKVSFDGKQKTTVENNNIAGLEKVFWSLDRSKVVAVSNKDGANGYYYYDYTTGIGTKLSEGIKYVTWDNAGEKIIYKYTDSKTDKSNLSVADPDGKNWRKVADISSKTWIAPVPQSAFISVWNIPNSLEETSLNLIGLVGNGTRKIFSGSYGTDYLWSPNGSKILASSANSKGGSKVNLAVMNSNGGEYQNLNIPTLVSKCAWSKNNKTVFYALPSFSSENSVLPNDYQNGKIISKDTFWKVDVTTGKVERIVEVKDIKDEYDATNLFLSPSEDTLFFVDKSDGKLYGINL